MLIGDSKYVCYAAIFSTGERFPVLLYRDSYQPVALVTRYIIDERRENKKSGTIARDSRVLRWLYEWCDVSNIRIEERLRNGEMFTKAEIIGFCRYLRGRRSKVVVGSIGTQTQNGDYSPVVLSPRTFNSYISVAESFLLWAAYEFIPVATPDDNIREILRTAVKRIQRAFRSVLKGGRIGNNRRGLTRDELEEIRRVIKPGSDQNPFKRSVQFRNHLIFELMLATGIRRGELLKIKLKHLPVGLKTTLSILREPDDRDDPRRNEPQAKTRMRDIPLHKKLAIDLWRYAHRDRKGNRNNQYLFTSLRGGLPLSSGAINQIFSFLVRKRLPQLRARLSPHVMRHTFNEAIVELGNEQGWEETKIKDLQRYLSGWSERSEMPARYTRRIIEAEAMKIAEKFQDSLYVF